MSMLVHCGMDLLKAKRAIEALLENAEVIVDLPNVEDKKVLISELARSGIDAMPAPVGRAVPSTVQEQQG
jgi:hypothetical protein